MKSLQETFDTVVNHLRNQGMASSSANGCWYRLVITNTVLKCAAGCLIPDEKYIPTMEGLSVEKNNIVGRVISEEGHNPSFVKELQLIHDRQPYEHFEKGFMELAQKYNLVYKEKE